MKKFIDKNKQANLNNGLEYFAVGLIVSENGITSSGKDYVVEYIDPWANYNVEYRSIDEIEISEISDEDANILSMAFESVRGKL